MQKIGQVLLEAVRSSIEGGRCGRQAKELCQTSQSTFEGPVKVRSTALVRLECQFVKDACGITSTLHVSSPHLSSRMSFFIPRSQTSPQIDERNEHCGVLPSHLPRVITVRRTYSVPTAWLLASRFPTLLRASVNIVWRESSTSRGWSHLAGEWSKSAVEMQRKPQLIRSYGCMGGTEVISFRLRATRWPATKRHSAIAA